MGELMNRINIHKNMISSMRWPTVSKRMRDWPRVTDNEIYRGCDQKLLRHEKIEYSIETKE